MLTWLGRTIWWLGVAIVDGSDHGCAKVFIVMKMVVAVVIIYCSVYIILLCIIYIILIY